MFQHILTPKVNPVKKSPRHETEEQIEYLSLAPFTSTPKLEFYEITVGTICTRKICIRNPTSLNVELFVLKPPPTERNVNFNWLQNVIPANSEDMLMITWLPQSEGTWRDTIQLTDYGRIRRDIPIAYRSIKPAIKKKKFGVKVKKPSPKRKSPKKRLSPASSTSSTNTARKIGKKLSAANLSTLPRRSTYNVQNKENLLSATNNYAEPKDSMRNTVFKVSSRSELGRIPNISLETFDDSLENPLLKQPLNNLNYSDIYTPKGKQATFCCSTVSRSSEHHEQHRNISSETYVKGNISGGTYVKDTHLNISGETYIKANISGGTYVKDGSIANLADLQLSPVEAAPCFKRNLANVEFISPLTRSDNALGNISEESSIEMMTPLERKNKRRLSSTPRKTKAVKKDSSIEITPKKCSSVVAPRRVSIANTLQQNVPAINITYDVHVSPTKAARTRSPVKRLSKGYNVKPMHLQQFVNNKSKTLITTSAVRASTSTRNPDLFYNNVCNPYVLAQTSGMDPFIAVTLYYDPQWMDEQIARFKNWLNLLLMPPMDLSCNNVKIDVARLWQECRNKDVEKAPSKEEASSTFNQNHLLQSLRYHASKLYRSTDILIVLSKCHGLVENKKFVMRTDKDLHQDIGLQKEILRLFFCYNPLWLRIGLEQVFGVHINLRSTTDVVGLSHFLLKNFFNNQYLLKKFKHKSAAQYGVNVKKESLKKFLSLIYFLDQAKLKKLIPYDPCLFSKNATVKESKEILLRFASELFSAIGDVTKPLRLINYVLHYKQTYIHEFEYGVESLGTDLKDGIRLTRVMEIILLEPTLTNLLRVPAISRLQKIHNVKLAFDALERAGYSIESKIEPKDIVEGHREKTLSFLWQIIYKFQSPRFTKAVVTVQLWWKSAVIQEKLAKLRAERLLRQTSAVKIQQWWRRNKLRQKIEAIIPGLRIILQEIKLYKAATVIQAQYRMYQTRRNYLQLYHSTVIIQRHFRRWYVYSHLWKRRNTAAQRIQETWRSYCERKRFLALKNSVHVIENRYKALMDMRKCVTTWRNLRNASLLIQRKYRATIQMRTERKNYLELQAAVVVIQRRWRATHLMRKCRNDYLELKHAACVIQRRWRAQQEMKATRHTYLKLRQHVVCVQLRFRAIKEMEIQRQQYLSLKQAVIFMQRRFRANLLAKQVRNNYLQLKKAVAIIETRYIAKQQMQLVRTEFIRKKNAVTVLQTRFRAVLEGRKCLILFCQLKIAVSIVERRFEARKLMRQQREQYQRMKQAAIFIQRKWRATQIMRHERARFVHFRSAMITIQAHWRAHILMRNQRIKYLHLKHCATIIQRKWRATLEMHMDRDKFKITQQAAIKIQRWYRDLILMRSVRDSYQKLRNAVVCVQRRFRAMMLMKKQRQQYVMLRETTIIVQRRFRAKQLMKERRTLFLIFKGAALKIQRKYRATKLMRPIRNDFLNMIKSAIKIQSFFRGYMKMQEEKRRRIQTLSSILLLQTYIRGFYARRKFDEMNKPEVKEQRRLEKLQKKAAIVIQAAWRGYRERSKQSTKMLAVRKSLEAVTRRARPEDTIQQRTKKNLLIIVNEKSSVLQVLGALKELEQTTRLSQNACIKLAQNNCCGDFYDMIVLSCRSYGDTQVSSAAVGILINIAKYQQTSKYAWLPECVNNLIKYMVGYCDKELNVFVKLATLLWIFGHNATQKAVICEMPNFAHQMLKMRALCERQQKMVHKSYKGKNPSMFAAYSTINVPMVKPDWGLEYPQKPYMFTNSVHGIRSLCQLFNV